MYLQHLLRLCCTPNRQLIFLCVSLLYLFLSNGLIHPSSASAEFIIFSSASHLQLKKAAMEGMDFLFSRYQHFILSKTKEALSMGIRILAQDGGMIGLLFKLRLS